MIRRPTRLALFSWLASTLLITAPAVAQSNGADAMGQSGQRSDGDPKLPIRPEDYGQWERLGGGTLSPNGEWLAVSISRVNDEDELRIHRVDGDSTVVVPYGTAVRFSTDGRWAAYLIGVSDDERESLQKRNEPVRNSLGLLDLETGETEVVEDVASFSFSGDDLFLAMRGYAPRGRESRGVDLVVRDLVNGTERNFGNIAEYGWQDETSVLALLIDAEGQAGNGIHLYDAGSQSHRVLDSERTAYKQLTWRDESADLAVLKVRTDEAYTDSTHVVLAWSGLDGGPMDPMVFDQREVDGFPDGHRVVDYSPIRWSEDGSMIFFGIKEWTPAPSEDDEAEDDEGDADDTDAPAEDEIPGVEVWHSRDVDIIPTQKRTARQDRNENWTSVWHVQADRFVQLEDETIDVSIVNDGTAALGRDGTPYDQERMFGPAYADYYRIDLTDGARTPVGRKVERSYGLSAGGDYYLYFADDHYWTRNLSTGEVVNITEGLDAVFTNVEDDHTVEQKPPHGMGGWFEGDEAVLLYDKYDLWMVHPDGSGGERLTTGAEESVRHRRVNLESTLDAIPTDQPIYVSLYGDRTKQYGYGQLEIGGSTDRLIFEDKNIGRLNKADDADVFAYVVQGFDDSPDYFVGPEALSQARQVTETNPFQSEYLWGRSELVDYENTWGVPLQGALYYPADYEPGRQYPMIVYYYEIVSNTVHSYPVPSETSAYNAAVWTSEGYFVFRPDIVYRDRNPGLSAKAALEPGVQAVLDMGMVDPARVGLVGHSWGGYQTAFMSTVSDMFAANVAGAPLTNLVSMYLSMYWNSGGTDARIFEISQGRMEVPPWEDMESYIANSPVHNIETMETPLLVAFGTEDGAVEYNQGVEFYNAARRAEKDLVLLVYEGENHSLAKEPNQIDYHHRIKEWFAHYLKGEPAPKWMSEGMSFIEQEDALKAGKR